MKPDFSEFSYGYAVTEELVAQHKASLVAAPLFPSLYDEGKEGGGYDVKIPLSGTPVFLQFKLSDQLERSNAKEYKDNILGLPYFRMHLRPTKHSDQHNLLLALESSGEAVFYVAPEFHLPGELNEYYRTGSVTSHSAAFAPRDIGRLPDDEAHYIVFERGGNVGYRCTDHAKKVTKYDLEKGLRSVLHQRQVPSRNIGDDGIREISERMLTALDRGLAMSEKNDRKALIDSARRVVEDRSPLESAGYLARTFFDAELLVLPAP